MLKIKHISHTPDIYLLVSVILLLLFGIVIVYDASVVVSHDVFGGKYHFLFLQSLWVGVSSIAAFFAYRIGFKRFSKLGFVILLFSIFLLFLVAWPNIPLLNKLLFVPTDLYDRFFPEIYGARRWIIVPGRISFQPSEFAKFSSIIYFSTWLSRKNRSPLLFFFLLLVIAGLIVLQPDFGTAMILVTIVLSIYFVSGVSLLKLGPLFLLIMALGAAFIFTSPYRLQRLQTYMDPSSADPLSSGYHIKQVLIALGSGGLLGLGFGQSRQKYNYLPEVTTDSIFAVVGEELGFVGALVLIFLFLFLIYRGFRTAWLSSSKLGRLLAVGVSSWISVQVGVNLAAMTALVPLTGVPLPLTSYGGSSMLFVMLALGLLLSVSRESVKKTT